MLLLAVVITVGLGAVIESVLIGVVVAIPSLSALYMNYREFNVVLVKMSMYVNALYFVVIFLGSFVMCSGGGDPAGKSMMEAFLVIFLLGCSPYLFNWWYLNKRVAGKNT